MPGIAAIALLGICFLRGVPEDVAEEIREEERGWRSDEDDAVLEESRVDVEGTLSTTVLFDDSRDLVVVLRGCRGRH